MHHVMAQALTLRNALYSSYPKNIVCTELSPSVLPYPTDFVNSVMLQVRRKWPTHTRFAVGRASCNAKLANCSGQNCSCSSLLRNSLHNLKDRVVVCWSIKCGELAVLPRASQNHNPTTHQLIDPVHDQISLNLALRNHAPIRLLQ